MGPLMTGYPVDLRRVDSATKTRVLAAAADHRAAVDLRANCDGVDISCSGIVVGDDGYLLVDVGPAVRALEIASSVHVSLEVDWQHFQFETRCGEEDAEIEPGVIRLVRPGTLAVVERRRSPRRHLRRTTEVILRSAAPDAPKRRTTMLNLSPDGIACRASTEELADLSVGETCRVAFDLATASDRFDLAGRIASVTQGGTPDQLVIGLEFLEDERSAAVRDRLREALNEAAERT